MKILCVGAGAIGISIGGSLAAQGADVTYLEIEKFKKKLEGRTLVIQVDGKKININSHSFISSSKDLESGTIFDCLLVAVKTFDTDSLIKQLKKSNFNFKSIVCLQNGVENEEKLQQAFQTKRSLVPRSLALSADSMMLV